MFTRKQLHLIQIALADLVEHYYDTNDMENVAACIKLEQKIIKMKIEEAHND